MSENQQIFMFLAICFYLFVFALVNYTLETLGFLAVFIVVGVIAEVAKEKP